jgi:hypothetical protein
MLNSCHAAGRNNTQWVLNITANMDWRFRHRGEYSPYHEDMRTSFGQKAAVWHNGWDPSVKGRVTSDGRQVYQILVAWNMTRLPFRCKLCQNSKRYMRLADELQLLPLYTEENCLGVMTRQNFVPTHDGNVTGLLAGRFIPPVYYDYWWRTMVNKSTVHSWGWDYGGYFMDNGQPRQVTCNVTSNVTQYANCQKENWYFHLFGTRADILFDRCYNVQEAIDNKRPHQACNNTCHQCGGL